VDGERFGAGEAELLKEVDSGFDSLLPVHKSMKENKNVEWVNKFVEETLANLPLEKERDDR
jgi:hypothetical protein